MNIKAIYFNLKIIEIYNVNDVKDEDDFFFEWYASYLDICEYDYFLCIRVYDYIWILIYIY